MIKVQGLTKSFRRPGRAARRRPGGCHWLDHHRHRAQRGREDGPAPPPARPSPSRRGQHPDRRGGHHPTLRRASSTRSPALRRRLPGRRPLRLPDVRGQRRLPPAREGAAAPGARCVRRVREALSARSAWPRSGASIPPRSPAGMRKRVAIARALVTEPEIVFFDEPTTGLDPVLVNAIHHLIMDLHRRRRFTAVMVSHEIPEIFTVADTVAMLHEGRIIEVGRPRRVSGLDEPRGPPVHPRAARTRTLSAPRVARGEARPWSGRASTSRWESFSCWASWPSRYLSIKLGRVSLFGSARVRGERRLSLVGRPQGRGQRRDRRGGGGARGVHRPQGRPGPRGAPRCNPRSRSPRTPSSRSRPRASSASGTSTSARAARSAAVPPNGQLKEVQPPVDLEELISKYVFGKV